MEYGVQKINYKHNKNKQEIKAVTKDLPNNKFQGQMVLVLHAYAVWRQPIIHPVDFLIEYSFPQRLYNSWFTRNKVYAFTYTIK